MPPQMPNSKGAGNIASPWPSIADWGTPAVTGCGTANSKLQGSFVGMSTEWQSFVGRRLSEDFHLLQELSTAKAPDQVWNAWSRYWQKAAEDYGREYSVIAKLAAGFVPNIAATSEGNSGKTLVAQPQSKAA